MLNDVSMSIICNVNKSENGGITQHHALDRDHIFVVADRVGVTSYNDPACPESESSRYSVDRILITHYSQVDYWESLN